MSEIYLKSRRLSLNPADSVGKGREADIFDIGGGMAVKIFHLPDHPDFKNLPQERTAAKERIREHQEKLKVFPKNLPQNVIAPQDLIFDASGKIVGYSMRMVKDAKDLMKYSNRAFREIAADNAKMVGILRNIHATVGAIHRAGAVIGDFNDLNVLIKDEKAYFVDADSFQFGKFLCRVFTERFIDPLICSSGKNGFGPIKPFSSFSDWYAFCVILMQSLLFVWPYGGVYLPKNPAKRIKETERRARRISVFDPEVRYPKPAAPYKILPDDLLHHLYLVFVKDWRGEFPLKLIEAFNWTKCPQCDLEHARSACPICFNLPANLVKETVTARGNVIASRIFLTKGVILSAVYQNGQMRWLWHENGQFRREDKSVVLSGGLNSNLCFGIRAKDTMISANRIATIYRSGKIVDRVSLDADSSFDANSIHYYWIESGRLMRDGRFGPEFIGNVLRNQTLFWIGEEFGFGFYRASRINVAFVFDAERGGINDRVNFVPILGQMFDAGCHFSGNKCWFYNASRNQGKSIYTLALIAKNGDVEATLQEVGEDSYLASAKYGAALGKFFFIPTDDGIIRFEADNGRISKIKEFPDTQSFVSAGCRLIATGQGIYTVNRKEINLLKMA